MERRDLGDFLRSRRERLDAASIGLPSMPTRRAPGLRREEVAVLAGVGVSWLTRIEQGRAGSVSADVLGALADALRLSLAERHHLFRLAGVHLPMAAVADLDPTHRRLVDGLAPNPAYLLDPLWNVVLWNEPEADLFPLLRAMVDGRPNLLRLFLEHQELRTTVVDWDDEIVRLVRQFRAHATSFPSDELAALINSLKAEHPAFLAAWERQDVEQLAPHGRLLRHAGEVRAYDQHRLPLPNHPGWLLVLFIPNAHSMTVPSGR